MPTLAEVTSETRVFLKWGGLILGLILLIFIGFRIYSAFFAPEPPPTVAFGKLNFEFPKSQNVGSLTYSIDTITGSLPSFPKQVKVHKIEEKESDLLSLARANEKVSAAGFKGEPISLSESIYQWKNPTPPEKTLTMNIFSNNFNLISSYLSDSASLTFKTTNAASAILASKTFLESLNVFPSDLDEEKTKSLLFSIKNFALEPATSISNAQVVLVNFYQKDINELPIFYSHPLTSPINFLVAEINNTPTVVEANFTYQKVEEAHATYPIKTADKAFSDLRENKAYIATYTGKEENVIIKKVSLGYFIGDKKQNYLMPVAVFEGNNFQAFVLGVTDEWVNR